MREFWAANLDHVYFFYGLAFFVAGLVMFGHWRDSGQRGIARTFNWLAAFALVHGANEWVDMWRLAHESAGLRLIGLHLLAASFLFLYEAGRRTLALSVAGKVLAGGWSTLALSGLCLLLMVEFPESSAAWPRYLLALPGGLLAAAGFWLYARREPGVWSSPLRGCLLTDVAALGAYALLAGLVVPPAAFFPASLVNQASFLDAFGVPVQVLRALCPAAMAWAAWSMLRQSQREAREGLVRETTTRQQAEAALLQAQKLEAVGLLAGGMAHDFNNVLTTIVGYNYFLLEGLEPGSPLRSFSLEIRKAADLAASLARQVLSMTRRQVVQPRVLEPNAVIMEMSKMFRRLLGEDIKLELHLHAALWPVKMDAGQLEQLLMNLVVNARDAMPHGGRLSVYTHNHTVREADALDLGKSPRPGQYVWLEVRDTGVGMDESVRGRIFEPFFTTKEAGRGTGLGLSIVMSIVKDYGGEISVESAPGRGATFRIQLPRAEGGVEALLPGEARKSGGEGSETILLVEDNPALRSLIKKVLRGKGYRVFSAANGREARLLGRRLKERVDLLLCDLILPDSRGTEVAAELCGLRPGMKVAYMSGYAGGVLSTDLRFDGITLIEKPFSPEALLDGLRRQLDAKKAESRSQAPNLPGLDSA